MDDYSDFEFEERFAFNKVPSVLRASILKCVDIAERLELLSSTKAIRQEILRQGLIPPKVDRLTLDFSGFRLEDGKLMAENLFINVHTDDEVCFGQPEYQSMLFGPFYSRFYRLTPASWPLFQRLRPRLMTFQTQQHETEETDQFEVFRFLPKVNHLYELQFIYAGIPENVQDAFFDNFPAKFTEACCGHLPSITKNFEDAFVKRYGECQIITLQGFSCEMLWEPLKKTGIKFLENLPRNFEETQSVLEKTLKEGLPFTSSEAEMVFWTNNHVYSHINSRPIEVFDDLLAIFQKTENSVKSLDEPQDFKTWAKQPREFVEEKYFGKKVNGIDYVWKLAKDYGQVFVFVRKLDV